MASIVILMPRKIPTIQYVCSTAHVVYIVPWNFLVTWSNARRWLLALSLADNSLWGKQRKRIFHCARLCHCDTRLGRTGSQPAWVRSSRDQMAAQEEKGHLWLLIWLWASTQKQTDRITFCSQSLIILITITDICIVLRIHFCCVQCKYCMSINQDVVTIDNNYSLEVVFSSTVNWWTLFYYLC